MSFDTVAFISHIVSDFSVETTQSDNVVTTVDSQTHRTRNCNFHGRFCPTLVASNFVKLHWTTRAIKARVGHQLNHLSFTGTKAYL